MKFALLFLMAALAFAATDARATVVSFSAPTNFSGSPVNMGTLTPGEYGTISNNTSTIVTGSEALIGGAEFASLSRDSAVTFTYTFSDMLSGTLSTISSYRYTQNGNQYNGGDSASSNGSRLSAGTVNRIASAPLAFASANLNPALTTGTITITNLSDGLLLLNNRFTGIFNSSGRVVSITYNVSSVPLPASLPLFAAVLMGLFGISYYRKRRAI